MCGICGKVSLTSKPVTEPTLRKMLQTLSHRGPDGEGFYLSGDKKVGFGHRRLAVIDLKTGQQPMTNEDKTIWLVFNGEIYNFPELKRDLEKKRHRFNTKSDTEVIIHAYEEYSERCIGLFNGMFAFAIWDERKNKLFLARDRLGKKPLFYARTPEAFFFASEIKALLVNPEIKREIDFEALGIYLSLGYFLAPFTIIKNLRKLPAASTLTFKNGRLRIKEYWDLDPTIKENLPEKIWIEKFNELMKESVELRLVSDVPLGAFLSGGVDSTTIVSLMQELSLSKTKTFSISFKEKSYNELFFARKAARFLKTKHQDLIVKPKIDEVLPKIIWFNDEPLGDTSAVPMFFLAKETRKRVKVALSGDGGDENLLGYETYIADKIFHFYRHFPFRSLIAFAILNFLPTTFGKVSFDYKLKQFVEAGDFSPQKAHYFWRVIFNEEEKNNLLNSEILKKIKNLDTFFYFQKFFNKYPKANFLDQAQYVDIKTWLVDDILVKVDRASMAHSLEVRNPFLDYRLVELLSQAPVSLKLKGFQTKYLLKEAMSDTLPKEIIHRPKAGFNAPIPVWLRKELKPFISQYLSEKNLKKLGFFNHQFIKSLMVDYFAGLRDNSLKLWLLLNFLIWYKIFISNK